MELAFAPLQELNTSRGVMSVAASLTIPGWVV